jgi:GntR family transcriptional regulator of vanillate catabolism
MKVATRGMSVTRTIRESILGGEFGGGARLNEVDLATSLGVSRTPIRAALSTLAAEGLLSYTPNSGYVVKSYSSADIAGIYEVRATLEGLGARLTTEKGLSDLHRGQMHKIIQDGEEVVSGGIWDEEAAGRWQKVNDDFHRTLNAAADNTHLEFLIQKSRGIPLLNQLKFRWFDFNSLLRAQEDHATIFEAITQRQVIRAEALAREHVYKSGARITEHWRKIESTKRSPSATRVRSVA